MSKAILVSQIPIPKFKSVANEAKNIELYLSISLVGDSRYLYLFPSHDDSELFCYSILPRI